MGVALGSSSYAYSMSYCGVVPIHLAVNQYPEAFLLTYYTFITPEELVDKLLYRYTCTCTIITRTIMYYNYMYVAGYITYTVAVHS